MQSRTVILCTCIALCAAMGTAGVARADDAPTSREPLPPLPPIAQPNHLPSPAPGASIEELPKPDRSVRLHVAGGARVDVEVLGGTGWWRRICSAPCDVNVPLDELYRFTGRDIQPSDAFYVRGPPGGQVAFEVRPTSKRAHTAGVGLKVAGAIGVGAGAAAVVLYGFLGFESAVCLAAGTDDETAATDAANAARCAPSRGVLWGGLAAAGVGAVALIVGFAVDVPTKVDPEPGHDVPEHREDDVHFPVGERWSRLPTWRETSSPLPTVTSVPLFSTTF